MSEIMELVRKDWWLIAIAVIIALLPIVLSGKRLFGNKKWWKDDKKVKRLAIFLITFKIGTELIERFGKNLIREGFSFSLNFFIYLAIFIIVAYILIGMWKKGRL